MTLPGGSRLALIALRPEPSRTKNYKKLSNSENQQSKNQKQTLKTSEEKPKNVKSNLRDEENCRSQFCAWP